MDYEKAYKDALERARVLKNKLEKTCSLATSIGIESIFPELKMSKHERVKKAITHILYENYTDAAIIEGVEIAEIVTWLENLAWSEEDEKIIETMFKEGDLKPSERQWLKSIKERIKGE